MSPPVTWLLPTLNAEQYLAEALASLQGQTYRNHQILAWDNGSTDRTTEILSHWIPARIPGRVVTDQPFNLLGDCLAAMVESAETELIARMDADDIALPRRLEQQIATLSKFPEWQVVGGVAKQINQANQFIPGLVGKPMFPDELILSFVEGSPLVHPSVVARRSAVLKAGNYSSMGTGQDLDLWYRMALNGPLGATHQIVLHYRVHQNSVSGKQQKTWMELQERLWRLYAPNLFPEFREEELLLFWQLVNPLAIASHQSPKVEDQNNALEVLERMISTSRQRPFSDHCNLYGTTTYERLFKRLKSATGLPFSKRLEFLCRKVGRKFFTR